MLGMFHPIPSADESSFSVRPMYLKLTSYIISHYIPSNGWFPHYITVTNPKSSLKSVETGDIPSIISHQISNIPPYIVGQIPLKIQL